MKRAESSVLVAEETATLNNWHKTCIDPFVNNESNLFPRQIQEAPQLLAYGEHK